jgi:hypothetical protein
MSKTREIACFFYQYEGCCAKGREGTFYKQCQHCDEYSPVRGGKPARENLKAKKLDKIIKKEKSQWNLF